MTRSHRNLLAAGVAVALLAGCHSAAESEEAASSQAREQASSTTGGSSSSEASSTTEGTTPAAAPGTTAETDTVAGAEPVPPSVDTIRGLLSARHEADVPDAAALAAHPEAEASLRWLAVNAGTSMVRTRALRSLGGFISEASVALLVTRSGDPMVPAAQRLGALEALGAAEAAAWPAALDALSAALGSDDPRLSERAAESLAATEAGRARLAALAADPAAAPAVRAHAGGALGN